MPTEDNKKNDDQYSFIKEQIVPKKENKTKKFLVLVGTTISLAIVFGLVCRIVFEASEPFADKILGKKDTQKVITLPSTSPGSEKEKNKEDTNQNSTSKGEKEGTKQNDNTSSNDNNDNNDTDNTVDNVQQGELATIEDYENMFGELRTLANDVNQSIVTVTSVVKNVDWFNNTAELTNSTSGLVIFNDGTKLFILTNKDKLKSTKNIKVTFSTEKTVHATYVSGDSNLGIVVIAVKLEDIPQTTLDQVKVAKFGQSYSITVGEPIIALGSPNGYVNSMDTGIVMNEVKNMYITDSKIELFNTNIADNPNGEGVIVNLEGEIIGIITQKFKTDNNKYLNTNLAISKIKSLIEKLVNKTDQAYFGIVGADLTSTTLKRLGVHAGVYVAEVENDSPAFQAGIESGDVILKLDGSEISSVDTFNNILSSHKPEDSIKVLIKRNRNSGTKQFTFKVNLANKK
ncbi:S1C family serine protease [Anaeromicropila herbilytica]|uniref:PDZ domain-containing protein n=1 Tax=Anaeromicropila herbilytica TaxID=2785025 RepID=A0A7R7EI49_9FIRM|nr:PDZ domain-containing protein [Anaeromicropila herbilytica]BCN29154.1 hypothetical protein bsdtb5_04490 [Anaeromicropila herbilytica]